MFYFKSHICATICRTMSLKYRTYNIGLHISFKRIWNFSPFLYTKDSTQGQSLRSISYLDLIEIFAERFPKLIKLQVLSRCYYLYIHLVPNSSPIIIHYSNCHLNYSRNTFFSDIYMYIYIFLEHVPHVSSDCCANATRSVNTHHTLLIYISCREHFFSILYTVVRITRVSSL